MFGAAASSALVLGAAVGSAWSPLRQVTGVRPASASGALISALAFELFDEAFALGGGVRSGLGLVAGAGAFVIVDTSWPLLLAIFSNLPESLVGAVAMREGGQGVAERLCHRRGLLRLVRARRLSRVLGAAPTRQCCGGGHVGETRRAHSESVPVSSGDAPRRAESERGLARGAPSAKDRAVVLEHEHAEAPSGFRLLFGQLHREQSAVTAHHVRIGVKGRRAVRKMA